MKTCRLCGVLREMDDFHRASGTKDGRRGECKICSREQAKARYPKVREREIARATRWREENPERFLENQRRARQKPERKRRERDKYLRRTYGITLERYEEMLSAQGGVCAVCERKPNPNISLHVDHDHATGRIRGLLCWPCNNCAGDLEDDPQRARRLADYLSPPQAEIDEVVDLIRERVRALMPA